MDEPIILDAPPAPPVVPEADEPIPDYITVVYNVPDERPTPIRAAGYWWHDRSEYRLPRALAEELLTEPGFTKVRGG